MRNNSCTMHRCCTGLNSASPSHICVIVDMRWHPPALKMANLMGGAHALPHFPLTCIMSTACVCNHTPL